MPTDRQLARQPVELDPHLFGRLERVVAGVQADLVATLVDPLDQEALDGRVGDPVGTVVSRVRRHRP